MQIIFRPLRRLVETDSPTSTLPIKSKYLSTAELTLLCRCPGPSSSSSAMPGSPTTTGKMGKVNSCSRESNTAKGGGLIDGVRHGSCIRERPAYLALVPSERNDASAEVIKRK